MLTTLRAWLNGTREYFTGVALYDTLGSDAVLKSLFKKGKTTFTYDRLQEELLKICNDLKKQKHESTHSADRVVHSKLVKRQATDTSKHQEKSKQTKTQGIADVREPATAANAATNENSQLYDACKKEADKKYKEVMNMRAELFALARMDDFTDINMPDKIQAREKLAIAVVTGYQQGSKLYDKADYVKQHGRLPNDDDEEVQETNVDNIPDALVKQTLDNLRKNYNKIKKREQTPERIALMQKHEVTIKQLEARWSILKTK
jgi:hypothetical protein